MKAEQLDKKLAAINWFAFAVIVGFVMTGAIFHDVSKNYIVANTLDNIGKWIAGIIISFDFILLLIYLFKKIIS